MCPPKARPCMTAGGYATRCNITDRAAAALASLTRLTSLDLRKCSELSDRAIAAALPPLTSLQSLR